MRSTLVLGTTLALASTAFAAIAQSFRPPSASPETSSANYTGQTNGTVSNGPVVPGKVFDRFIQIWIENTDFATAASSPVFQSLSKEGILLESFYAVTHPSEPNYIAAVGGDFFGSSDDDFYHIPQNISSVVDLLEAKNISWASYQENMPYDGFTGFNFTENDYLLNNGSTYVYYVRKHNGLIIFDSVTNVTDRALRVRNFNDFANDVKANDIPQWNFITPNLVNDGHDTTIDFVGDWLNFWLIPLLGDEKFNNNRTIILLTFDENETTSINNRIYTLIIGGGVPKNLRGTTDPTFYTHYSALSTVQANWGLQSLGRQDTNSTVNNVFEFVANATGWKNNGISGNSSMIPLLNISGPIPGPLNVEHYIPFAAPNASAVGAGGQGVFVAQGVDASLTAASLPAPVNLTAQGQANPWGTDPGINYASGNKTIEPPSPSNSGGGSGGSGSGSNAAAAMGAGSRGGSVWRLQWPSSSVLWCSCSMTIGTHSCTCT
ncbi:phosphoesterase family-domain-containing protein [Daedaleopsis nitida]|nr:phosphoesterase family-domain-containing protein [Daedaleopsis nitida]